VQGGATASRPCRKSGGGDGPITAESLALTTSTSASLAVGQSVTIYVHASDANGTRIANFSAVP